MKLQPLSAKLGEVKYRSKIINQQLGNENIFPNELKFREFTKLIQKRLLESRVDFDKLYKSAHSLSPYLEIGAENALRSAFLENKYKARGFAIDISLYSLAKAREFAKNFKFQKVPKTICADTNNLPFKSNSFPFIFVYETLHHFPDPKPILSEIERVLAPQGICLIGAEPIKPKLQITLWRRPNILRPWEKFLKVLLVLPFISTIGKTETDYGILEESFSLSVWQNALSTFDKVEAQIFGYPFGPSQTLTKSQSRQWLNPNIIVKTALLIGGGLKALCTKNGEQVKPHQNLDLLLICPDCLKNQKKEYSLIKSARTYRCTSCKKDYYKKERVLVLLEKNLEKKILQI